MLCLLWQFEMVSWLDLITWALYNESYTRTQWIQCNNTHTHTKNNRSQVICLLTYLGRSVFLFHFEPYSFWFSFYFYISSICAAIASDINLFDFFLFVCILGSAWILQTQIQQKLNCMVLKQTCVEYIAGERKKKRAGGRLLRIRKKEKEREANDEQTKIALLFHVIECWTGMLSRNTNTNGTANMECVQGFCVHLQRHKIVLVFTYCMNVCILCDRCIYNTICRWTNEFDTHVVNAIICENIFNGPTIKPNGIASKRPLERERTREGMRATVIRLMFRI